MWICSAKYFGVGMTSASLNQTCISLESEGYNTSLENDAAFLRRNLQEIIC